MHWVFQSEDWYGNVVFNFRHDPISDLAAFAAGYHEAGKRLCRTFVSSGHYRDFDGYPILFLYRHSLELYMKAIVYRGAQLLHLLDITRLDTSKLFKVHRLSALLPGIKIIFDGVGWTWETDVPGMRTFQEFSELVEGIEELDPASYTFRYPTDTQGHAALGHHTRINCLAFARNLDPILELLDGAVTGLTEEFDATAEAKFELQSIVT
ncbi:MAG: hypothetical protein ACLQPD_33280 [Desulfomonilaceae bacterium]